MVLRGLSILSIKERTFSGVLTYPLLCIFETFDNCWDSIFDDNDVVNVCILVQYLVVCLW